MPWIQRQVPRCDTLKVTDDDDSGEERVKARSLDVCILFPASL